MSTVNRAVKEKKIADMQAQLADQEMLIALHNKGLTVKQVTQFRDNLRKEGAALKVTKNTLAKLALKDTKFAELSDLLSGPVGLVSSKDMLAAARITYDFAKGNDKLVILGAVSKDGKLDAAQIKTLALLPSLDALRGKIIGILQAPGAQLARLAQAYADKDGGNAESVTETASAEAPAA